MPARIERLDDARNRAYNRDCSGRASTAFDTRNHVIGHAEQAQPLPRRCCQRRIAKPSHRQELGLRAAPFRELHINDRRARADHITGRMAVSARYEPARARLDDCDIALIEVDATGYIERAGEAAHLGHDHPDAEILHGGRIDTDAGCLVGCRAAVGIFGDGFHAHRGQGVWVVVTLLRHHRIVIIEDLAGFALGRALSRRWNAALSEPISAAACNDNGAKKRCAPACALRDYAGHWLSSP